MYSMTGYGKGVASDSGNVITVELKTVNHRYLDYGIKLSKNFLFLEDSIKKAISSSIARGHVDLFITYEPSPEMSAKFSVNTELAKGFVAAAKELKDSLGDIEDDITLGYLMKLPDIVARSNVDDGEQEATLRTLTLSALSQAIDKLKLMRQNEGEALKRDLAAKLNAIEGYVGKIEELAPGVVESYRQALNARIAEVTLGHIDEARLATEVALYADHCAIDEEITRLKAHIANMRGLLDSDEPVGRKMEFLVQEFNREANTIGSKANDLAITGYVLAIKNEIEKMREQSANVE